MRGHGRSVRHSDILYSGMKTAVVSVLAMSVLAAETIDRQIRPLLERHCFQCHSTKLKTAGFDLESLAAGFPSSFLREFRTWETVAEQIATHTMPPAAMTQPSDADRRFLVSWIDRQIQTMPITLASASAKPAPPAMRRLTRFEFLNTVRDLTGTELDLGSYLPPDGASQDGLPNNAGTLFVSGVQLEKLLAASELLMSHATFSPTLGLRFHQEPQNAKRHEDRIHSAASELAAVFYRVVKERVEGNGEGIARYYAAAWEAKHRLGSAATAGLNPEILKRLTGYLELDHAKAAIAGGGLADDFVKLRHHFDPLFLPFRELPNTATNAQVLEAGRRFAAIAGAFRQNDEYIEQLRAGDHSHPFDIDVKGGSEIFLSVSDAGDGNGNDYAAWLDGAFTMPDGSKRSFIESGLLVEETSADGVVARNTDSRGGPLHVFVQASELRGIRDKLYKDPSSMNRSNPLYRDNTLPWSTAIAVKAPSLLVLRAPMGAQRFTVRGALQDLARTRFGEKSRKWFEDGMVQFFVRTERPANLDFEPGARLTASNRTQVQNLRRFFDNLVTKYFPSPTYWIRGLEDRFGRPHTGIFHLEPEQIAAMLPPSANKEKKELSRHWDEYLLLAAEPRIVRERTEQLLNGEYRRLMSRKAFDVKGRELSYAEIRALASEEIKSDVAALDRLEEKGRRDLRDTAIRHLSAFASRAFRRPASASEIAQLTRLYDSFMQDEKAQTQDAVRFAARSVSTSPHFLYLSADPASRLSYFLWSSLPDEELLGLAAAHRLADPPVRVAQMRRMLKDKRSAALADQFAGSWLRFRNIRDHDQTNRETFPQFTDSLREAMYQEALQFTREIFREDASILNFLDSDFTFANEELARHYGLRGVSGADFRRVPVDRAERGGLLGMAGILTLTSHPARTSPVSRGVYVLTEVLGSPPPPPPPDASRFDEKSEAASAILTPRQQLEAHRNNPACAACHRRIDPVGFALENFDAIGRFRKKDTATGVPIDTASAMPDGRPITSFQDLKRVLLSGREKEKFVRTFCRQLLAYALGRSISYHDLETLRRMERALAARQYRVSAAIEEVVQSPQFRDQPAAVQRAGLKR